MSVVARLSSLAPRGTARIDSSLARRRARFDPRAALLLVACGLTSGCAGHADRTLKARSALDAHDARKALELYDEELEVKSGAEQPKEVAGDNALLLLDRSAIAQ